MKTNSFKRIAQLLTGISIAFLGSPVFAVQTWDLNVLCTSSSTTKIATGSCGSTLSVAGVSTEIATTGTTSSLKFNAATVYDYGTAGLGVVASPESATINGPHATDNRYGTDAMLLTFSTGVNLSSVKIGWNGADSPTDVYIDSDMSVLAWMGSTAPILTGTSAPNLTSLVGSGWKLISDYSNVGSITSPVNTQAINATNADSSKLYSSYWLISAFSSSYGGPAGDTNIDAFKVLALASSAECAAGASGGKCNVGGGGKVPEPGSLALLGVGLVGLVTSRRRNQKVA